MSAVTPIRNKTEQALLSLYVKHKDSLQGQGHFAQSREAAFRSFEKSGLPHRRIEAWHYTDLRSLLREAAPLAPKPQSHVLQRAAEKTWSTDTLNATRVMLVNGFYDESLSSFALPKGVKITDVHKALSGDPQSIFHRTVGTAVQASDPLIDLNTAFLNGGAVIEIEAGTKLEHPLEIRCLVEGIDPLSVNSRILVIVGKEAELTLIENHQGPEGLDYQSNQVVEIVIADKAQVQHVRLGQGGNYSVDLSTLAVVMGEETLFNSFHAISKPGIARHQVFAKLAGASSSISVNGVNLLNGTQHADTTLAIGHAAPDCTSRELFKTILDAQATGVFQGKIMVKQIAQKTDGKMMSQAVLLSDNAKMNNKPELEIFADDVVCGHGATCGALDDDLLFYLMARGLPKPEAEALMLAAFAGEAIETVAHEGVREILENMVEQWLAQRSHQA
jgi:Fe-S cluster assembly protein SufD